MISFPEDNFEIQKLHTQFRNKKYRVYPDLLIPATRNSEEIFNKTKEVREKDEEDFYQVDDSLNPDDELEKLNKKEKRVVKDSIELFIIL